MDATYINVDLSPGSAPGVLNVSQNDSGRPLGVKLFLNGAAFTLTGYGATVETLKPDGNLVTIAGTVSGNMVTWSTTEQQTAVAGKCMSEVRITDGSADIGSANFILMVESSPEAEGVESASEVSSLYTLVSEAAAKYLSPDLFYTRSILGKDWDTVTLGNSSNTRRYTKTGNVLTIDSNLGSGTTYQAISIYGDEPWTLNANIASHLSDIPDSLFLPLPYLVPSDNRYYQNILSLRYSVLNAPNIYGGPSGSSMGFIIVTKTSDNVRTSYGLDFNSTSLNGVQTMRIAQISELPDVAANGNFAILLRTTRPNMKNTAVCWTLEVTLIDSPTRNAVVNA